jgi:hypothetical protein
VIHHRRWYDAGYAIAEDDVAVWVAWARADGGDGKGEIVEDNFGKIA